MDISRRLLLRIAPFLFWRRAISSSFATDPDSSELFSPAFAQLDSLTTGEWWKAVPPQKHKGSPPPAMDVPREDVVAFALYTHDRGVLKLTGQLYPLKPGEEREVRLELQFNGTWMEVAREQVIYPGWSSHFRIENWDSTKDVPYRVRHGDNAIFEGLIRHDPLEKDEILVANMSCNSSRTGGLRPEIISHLREHNPDLLFFAGDQTYRHTEHTAGWIEFGLQFRDVIRDRPTICIPDDHDVGQGNLWGENGKLSTRADGADGGFIYPPEYINLVQRQQTSNLPDPVDPKPVERGINVYFTNVRVGGIDFAILEDRKFKSGPAGKIPQQGPRPDHINDPSYDPQSVDLPGLELLGSRQEKFLQQWTQDWTGTDMKAVLSATPFCGAVHMHGKADSRLLADLDCNGWPQSKRNRALEEIRKACAVHLCGDQHLAVVVKHGIEEFGDGPYSFTSPALVNTTYGRWWHPLDEKAGPNPVANSMLPWTGDFRDGLGNKISIMAYTNPANIAEERTRADGYGLVRFNKQRREITFECWPRFADANGRHTQFDGWPVRVASEANDGRKPTAYLPTLQFRGPRNAVVQVIDEETNEILYTARTKGSRFQPHVYRPGRYTVKVGLDKPTTKTIEHLMSQSHADAAEIEVAL